MSSKDLNNEFSWSNSRHDLFHECKRKYFLHYYGSWGGWEEGAPERPRTLYRLKNLDNRYTWRGTTLHEAIAFLLVARLKGKEVGLENFGEKVIQRMRNQYRTSLAGEYVESPKRKFGLLEHEYDEQILDDTWQGVRDGVLDGLTNFTESEFWNKAEGLSLDDCLALEGGLSNSGNKWPNISPKVSTFVNLPCEPSVDKFFIDDLKVWAKLDFAYPEKDGTLRIVDWKSGKSKDEPDPIQLDIYGYYGSEAWDYPAGKIKLAVYNLVQDKRYNRTFSKEQKSKVQKRVLDSAEEMRDMLIDSEANKARRDDFPKVDNEKLCRYCRYRRVCGLN